MSYTVIIFSLICCTCLPAFALSDARDCVREQHAAVIAQANTTAAPDKKAPDPQKKDSASGDARKPEARPGQNEKKPPPKDFVPSEKIDADKAVDFPVDI